ncbi:hypothetical protein [Vibrio crassostreae]|uniref:hypothetical protein n=1 Tax=Vibrio crassostreae TaxID=246167 RepID=UPI001B301D33|nr:hypothetical protein [Vibrio crassostreae]
MMLTARDVYNVGVEQRAELILTEAGITNSDDDLAIARKISEVINVFVNDYFQILIENDGTRADGSVLLEPNFRRAVTGLITEFKPRAISEIERSIPVAGTTPKNVYELSGATTLSGANNVTRNLSTTLGLLWESIADVSPYAINSETEFGLKIKGIDLISKNIDTGHVEYQQLKTQKNTLTGSQRGRSIAELSLHEHPVFCACFSLSSWTFNHPTIPRVAGSDFWRRIGIQYEVFVSLVTPLIQELEEEYRNL